MEGRATTVVTSHRAAENQALLDSELPTECRYSNARGKKTHFFYKPLLFHKQELSYVFPTRLGRCQSLGTRWMGASYKKEGYSHKIFIIAAKQHHACLQNCD
jgi:hypothetical protein